MKKILLFTFCIMTLNSFSQESYTDKNFEQSSDTTETINIPTQKAFQYRISFSQVSSKWTSKSIETEMFDLFKSEATYNEQLNQYVFNSIEDIDRIRLVSTFSNYNLTYFKKIPIIAN